ncbi:MAG: DUF6261 family protein [Tannerellaceae bacterium]|jgi:hypothetical protein|nr:DUF6261 family protein [Tannerellaceae bacterium]
MENKIMQHKYILYLLSVAQAVEFHVETTDLIRDDVALVEQMTDLMADYEAATQALEEAFGDSRKSFETEFIAGSDVSRDAISAEIIRRVNFVHSNPTDEAEREAARLLKFEIDKYNSVIRHGYTEETLGLFHLIIDLRKHPDALNLLGIEQLLLRLEAANNAFEQQYLIRTVALEAKRERTPVGKLALKANKSFEQICISAAGLIISRPTDEVKAALTSVISHINGQIHDYTTIVHRHSGVLASRRKKKQEAAQKAKEDGKPEKK